MTSNIGAQVISNKSSIGFVEQLNSNEEKKTEAVDVAKKEFKPEFINRIDDIVSFNSLTRDNIKQIVNLCFNDYVVRAEREHNIRLRLHKSAVDFFVDNGYDEKYGVRELKRVIKNKFETLFASDLLSGKFKNKNTVTVMNKNDKIYFKATHRKTD